MLSLEIKERVFKGDFLDGKGRVELRLAKGQFTPEDPFSNGMTDLISISASANSALEFGRPDDVKCKVDFSSSGRGGIELIWPGQISKFLEAHPNIAIPPGKIGAHLCLNATASAGADVRMPAGPAGFGIIGGAAVVYDRFALYTAGAASGSILADLVTRLRLPQHCGSPDRIPDPGELLVFRYNGYLSLKSTLNWGYQLSGSAGIDFSQLHVAAEYDIRMKASVHLGYTLAGEYAIEASRGQRPDWIRIAVKKRSDRKFDSAAAFDLTMKAAPQDCPASADEFLAAVLGADATSVLALFRKIRRFSDIEALEKEAGKLLVNLLQRLSCKWLGVPVDENSLSKFLSIADRAVSAYDALEMPLRDQLTRVIHLYEDYWGESKQRVLEHALEQIARLESVQGFASLDSESWAVAGRLAGGDLLSPLQDIRLFHNLTNAAQGALEFYRGHFMPEMSDLIRELKSTFDWSAAFSALAGFACKEKLLTLANLELQAIVEKLLGMAWEKIDASNVAEAAARLKLVLDKTVEFKNVWYQRVVDAVNQSFAIQLNYAYARARRSDALIDVEIDLSSESGRRLYAAAVHGDFNELFVRQNLPLLVIHHGELTHSVTKSTCLNINLFGWKSKHLVEVITETENMIQAGPTGEIQVFATEVSIRERREKRGRDRTAESVQSNFLMRFAGEAFLPSGSHDRSYLIRSVNHMAARYDFALNDRDASADELRTYLAFAATLGLLPSADAFMDELRSEFPQGFGKVRARYVAAFDNDSLRNAFTLTRQSIARIVHEVTQSLVHAQIVAGQPIHDDLTVIGLLSLDKTIRDCYERDGFTSVLNHDWTIRLSDGTQRTLKRELNLFVVELLDMEYKIARRLIRLDDVIDRAMKSGEAVPEEELEESAKEFVEATAELSGVMRESVRINSFFAVIDALAYAGSSGKGYRESSMVLEFQPVPGGKVIKYLLPGNSGLSHTKRKALTARHH